MFSRLVVNITASAPRAFCVPSSQPISAATARVAGRPNRRAWKNSRVSASSCAEGCISCRATPLNGIASRPTSRAISAASTRLCNSTWRSAPPSPRPTAWAAKPVALMRRMPKTPTSMAYRLPPTTTAPSCWVCGRWPMTAVSTSVTRGTERLDRIIGAARAQTLRWVGVWRQASSNTDMGRSITPLPYLLVWVAAARQRGGELRGRSSKSIRASAIVPSLCRHASESSPCRTKDCFWPPRSLC